MQRRLGRDCDLGRGGIGPQPQIDAEHIAVAGALLQQPRHALRDPHEERLRLDVGYQRGGSRIEEHDQVDVAGIIQFARAHLAHGKHDQTASLLRPVEIRGVDAAARDLLPQQKAQRHLHRGDREIGQRRGYLHHRPDPADVAQRDQQRGLGLHAPKQMHHIGFARRHQHFPGRLLDQRFEVRLRVARQQPFQPRGVGAHQVEQIRREFRDPEQDILCVGMIGQLIDRSRLRRLELGKPVVQALFGFVGRGDMRSVHETRGQNAFLRVARRG